MDDLPKQNTCGNCALAIGFMPMICSVHLDEVSRKTIACIYHPLEKRPAPEVSELLDFS